MSAIFCCTHPRSYSPSSELGAAALPVQSLSLSHGRRKIKRSAGRRLSRQDIEAFYQEGKRLQEVEESRDCLDETSYLVPSSLGFMQDGVSENQAELLNGGMNLSEKIQEVHDRPYQPRDSSTPKPSSRKTIALPIRISSIPRNHTLEHNTPLMKLASQMSSSTQIPSVELFSPLSIYNGEASASMKEAKPQHSHSVAIIRNQVEQGLALEPSYDCETEGNGSIRSRRRVNITEVEQNLNLEASNLYKSVELLKPGEEAALDINSSSPEDVCPQPSILTKMHFPEPRDFFLKIPKLVRQSNSSLTNDSDDRDQTPLTRASNGTGSFETSMEPLSSLAGRDKTRVYLDSSSSYYTSNASSFRSSIDLTISVPPISSAMIAQFASRISPTVPTSVTPDPRGVSTDNPLYARVTESLNPTRGPKADEFKTGGDREINQRYAEVGVAFNHEKGPIQEGDPSSVALLQKEEISKVKDHGSSVWDAGSSRRPLLTEAGRSLILIDDKKWDYLNDEPDKRTKAGIHKKSHNNGLITDDFKNWLDEQHTIRRSPMNEKKFKSMTFKKTITKGVSKLRNRLSSNLKPAGTLPITTTGIMKHAAADGRGEFSRLHTPTESVTTDKTTIIGDYINVVTEDVTPNSEQVMANITFTPSIPTELRLDGSLEDYDDFQTEELIVQENTTASSALELAPIEGSLGAVQIAAAATVNQNRYSAIYDDCVIFPFLSDDEFGSEEETTTDASFVMPCIFSDCVEVLDVTHDVERRTD